jgi:hypothetical protein
MLLLLFGSGSARLGTKVLLDDSLQGQLSKIGVWRSNNHQVFIKIKNSFISTLYIFIDFPIKVNMNRSKNQNTEYGYDD